MRLAKCVFKNCLLLYCCNYYYYYYYSVFGDVAEITDVRNFQIANNRTLYEHNPVTLGYYICFLFNANNDLVTSLFWSIASDLGIF